MIKKDYCNKIIEITFEDHSVKYHHFTSTAEYKLFMKMAPLFDDVAFVDVYDHVHTQLTNLERCASKVKDIGNDRLNAPRTSAMRREKAYGQIRHTTCHTSKACRSRKG